MPVILPVEGVSPTFGSDCFIAPNATIVGDVIMGDQCSVWFNAVVRGDVNSIRIGNKVNVQDGAVIHATYQKTKVIIGNNVSIGHNAIVHGCTLHDNVLVGMGAIVMDNAEIGSNSIIAAGAVILEGTKVEAGSIYAGVPAKKVKDISQELISGEINRIANNYIKYASWFSLSVIFILLLLASCKTSQKSGCPSNGKNVGAERVLSGEKLPKVKKFRS
jgi:carbonic anhydrase/acetyltransferase-like protein (isoleucine patch superfamily)